MNLYEHTIITRQDVSPSQIKSLKENYFGKDEVDEIKKGKKKIDEK